MKTYKLCSYSWVPSPPCKYWWGAKRNLWPRSVFSLYVLHWWTQGMDFYEWWFIYYEWFLFLVFLGTQLLLSENAHGEDDNLDLVLKLKSFVTISELISGSQFFCGFFFFFPFLKTMLWERESWNKICIPSSTNFLKNSVIYTVIKRYALICFCRE